ncbi:MAG: DME family drug/metabolite transporter [Granulosicoccus sp.]|jgi:DME family drug/metabolite transporter
MQDQTYRRGVLYIVAAGIFLSTGGIFIRFIENASPWTVLFYRSTTFTVTVALFLLARDRKTFISRFRAVRGTDLVISMSLALGFITYVLSLFNTSVANTVLILSTGPVFAALLGWLVLREKVTMVTWLAMLIAFSGVAVMVSGGIAASDKLGIIYALLAVMTFSVMIVMLRRSPANHDTMPATALAGICAAVMCLFFVPTLQISMHDLLLSIALGSVQVGMGFILITLGSRSVPAAQVPLLALAETALAPLWVWLLVNETPARNTLMGGTIVLCAVAFQGISGLRRKAQ